MGHRCCILMPASRLSPALVICASDRENNPRTHISNYVPCFQVTSIDRGVRSVRTCLVRSSVTLSE